MSDHHSLSPTLTGKAAISEELSREAALHERRAKEIENVKQKQEGRHDVAMKKIQVCRSLPILKGFTQQELS